MTRLAESDVQASAGPVGPVAVISPPATGVGAISNRARRLATVIASHPVVDTYSNFMAPLIGILLIRCDLTARQEASLIGISSLSAGLAQPVFAFLADRLDTRVFAPLGLVAAAVCMSSIGMAQNYGTLVVLIVIGMGGVGIYHPIAVASAGRLSGRRRTTGVTVFFACGMVGATIGPLVSTRLTALDNGFMLLGLCMIPGILVAFILHRMIHDVPHASRQRGRPVERVSHVRTRWFMMMLITIGNALRYSVNIALIYLYVQWAESATAAQQTAMSAEAIASEASLLAGTLQASMMFGMGLGGLIVGTLATRRTEIALFTIIPLLFAPTVAAFTVATPAFAWLLAILAGIGFAAVIPVSISVAQRLLPHRASVASSLAMGVGWAVASLAPNLAQRGIERFGLTTTFLITAGVLALSGIVSIPIRTRGLTDEPHEHTHHDATHEPRTMTDCTKEHADDRDRGHNGRHDA